MDLSLDKLLAEIVSWRGSSLMISNDASLPAAVLRGERCDWRAELSSEPLGKGESHGKEETI